ncbi:hypothetical protein EV646_112273 [Kribbella antiqua]|uniref:Uncharacterized protein n=1 Tax=Kribbella antiqua TaxID=2512217 RepID=A0A4R2ILY7_9ACTN|nr:hypothetical protein [Kribbella antiqua]TCO43695.1 hypothetical protein EV646_112273 [Kribbella antiqua]
MSFDPPGMPRPGRNIRGETEETLTEEGVEVTDHSVTPPDHPGAPSPGPQPYTPRRPAATAPEPEQAAEAEAEQGSEPDAQPRHRRDVPPDAEPPQTAAND